MMSIIEKTLICLLFFLLMQLALSVTQQDEVIIIGRGAIGLMTGIVMLESGLWNNISVLGESGTPNTTSDVAAAFWLPFLGVVDSDFERWSNETYLRWREMQNVTPGIRAVTLNYLIPKNHPVPPIPWWADIVTNFVFVEDSNIAGYSAFTFDTTLIETYATMPWLEGRFLELGGKLGTLTIEHLDDIRYPGGPIIIHATGLGAQTIVPDDLMVPIRGQLVVVDIPANFDMNTIYIDEESGDENLAYIVPRSDGIVLGGTAQEGDYNVQPNDEDIKSIVERTSSWFPELRETPILRTPVGLRPFRESGVRLELQCDANGIIVHNYGHSGSGFTIGWGTAAQVLQLLLSFNPKNCSSHGVLE